MVTLRRDLYGAVVWAGRLFVSVCDSVKGAVRRCHLRVRDGDLGGLGGGVEDERTVFVCFERVRGLMICPELILNVSDKFGVVGGRCEFCGSSALFAFLIFVVVGVTALVVSMVQFGDT